MGKLWTEEHKFRTLLDIEILACEAQAELGIIPKDAVKVIREKASFDIKRIEQIEAEVKHDVIAFLTNVGEYVGPVAIHSSRHDIVRCARYRLVGSDETIRRIIIE